MRQHLYSAYTHGVEGVCNDGLVDSVLALALLYLAITESKRLSGSTSAYPWHWWGYERSRYSLGYQFLQEYQPVHHLLSLHGSHQTLVDPSHPSVHLDQGNLDLPLCLVFQGNTVDILLPCHL